MNESTLTRLQLKLLVERAVRPVRASMSRKRKMREELLAHVSAVFEEEAAGLNAGGLDAAGLDNEQAALERTARRFGSPAELTGQLQASVPTSDFLPRFFEGMALRTDESTLRRAVRFAVVTFLVFAAFSAYFSFSVQRRVIGWPLMIAFQITALYFTLASEPMRQALDLKGRSWRWAAVVAAALSFLVPGATFGMLLYYSGDVRSSLIDALAMLPASVLTPVFVVVPVCCFAAEFRSHREWTSLQIN